MDTSNNIYITGSYSPQNSVTNLYDVSGSTQTSSTITLQQRYLTSTVPSTYVIKYNTNGICQWATNIVSAISGNYGNAIQYNNAIYVTGYIVDTSGTNYLFDTSGNTQSLSNYTMNISQNNNSLYLIKYNTEGKIQWSTVIDALGNENGYSIHTDTNYVYVTGTYRTGTAITLYDASGFSQTTSQVTLKDTTFSLSTNTAAMIIKYNTLGIAKSATCIYGTPLSGVSSSAISYGYASGVGDSLYFGGRYSSKTDVIVYDASGNIQVSSGITMPLQPNGNITAASYGFLIKYN
jgi:hypothetical protein